MSIGPRYSVQQIYNYQKKTENIVKRKKKLERKFVMFKNIFFDTFKCHFFVGASAKKRFARSRIFRYWMPQDILSKKKALRD